MSRERRIAVQRPAAEVTTIARDREVPPTELGLPHDAAERIWKVVEELYATGVHPAITMCVRRRGQVLIDRSIGHSHGNGPDDRPDGPKKLATPDTPICLFSASKAITAMVIHLLDDRGVLHVGDRVAEYIPEFAKHGKEWVTVRHVLGHRSGLPTLGGEEDVELLLQPDRVIARLCEARLANAPGRRLAYHAITGGFLLGEIVRRVTGKDLRQVLHDEILGPLNFQGMNYGWPADRTDEVAQNAFTGRPAGPVIDRIARRALGVSFERAVEISNSPTWLTALVPAGNIVGTANETSRFYELLLREGTLDGVAVFPPRTVRRALIETSHLELDFTMLLPIRYSEGLMLGANYVSIYGPDTARVFGHLGFTNVYGYADPARDLSVALLTTGKPLFSRHLLPTAKLLWTISRTCGKV
jgi:CubicO group peptidase (beta-lactamase class C family)